jgi:hypothetical protein
MQWTCTPRLHPHCPQVVQWTYALLPLYASRGPTTRSLLVLPRLVLVGRYGLAPDDPLLLRGTVFFLHLMPVPVERLRPILEVRPEP